MGHTYSSTVVVYDIRQLSTPRFMTVTVGFNAYSHTQGVEENMQMLYAKNVDVPVVKIV